MSQSFVQSVASVKEQSKSEIVYLNEEIDRRDKLINELKTKLSEATDEINESATVIGKLKANAQKYVRVGSFLEKKSIVLNFPLLSIQDGKKRQEKGAEGVD